MEKGVRPFYFILWFITRFLLTALPPKTAKCWSLFVFIPTSLGGFLWLFYILYSPFSIINFQLSVLYSLFSIIYSTFYSPFSAFHKTLNTTHATLALLCSLLSILYYLFSIFSFSQNSFLVLLEGMSEIRMNSQALIPTSALTCMYEIVMVRRREL